MESRPPPAPARAWATLSLCWATVEAAGVADSLSEVFLRSCACADILRGEYREGVGELTAML